MAGRRALWTGLLVTAVGLVALVWQGTASGYQATVALGVALGGRTLSGRPLWTLHYLMASATLLLAALPAAFSLARLWPRAWEPAVAAPRREVVFAALAASSLLLVVLVEWCGSFHFGGADNSVLVDAAWRQYVGQRPYFDFICPLPPLFFLLAKYAMVVWGPCWEAFLHVNALIAVVTLWWGYALLVRLVRSAVVALLLMLCCHVQFSVLCAYLWYNPLTMLVACLLIWSAMLLLQAPDDRLAMVSYTLSLALVAVAKPNTAALLIGATTVVLLSQRRTAGVCLAASLLSGALVLLSFAANGFGVGEVLTAYAGAAGRGRPSFGAPFVDLARTPFMFARWIPVLGGHHLPFEKLASVGYLLCLSVAGGGILRAGLAARSESPTSRRLLAMAAGSCLVAWYGAMTNMDLKHIDAAVLVAGLGTYLFAIRAEQPWSERPVAARSGAWFVALAVILMFSGLAQGASRRRIEEIGYNMFYQWTAEPLEHPNLPLFRHLRASPLMCRAIDEARQATAAHGTTGLFFGTRLEFLYAGFGVPSPVGLPQWWHPGTGYPLARKLEMVARWDEARFRTLIFLVRADEAGQPMVDFTWLPSELVDLIGQKYVRDERYHQVAVFTRK